MIHVGYFGDSTAYGVDTVALSEGKGFVPSLNNPPDVATKELTAQCHKPVMVSRLGVPASTAGQLLSGGNEFYERSFKEVIAASNASVVVFNFGINDAIHSVPPDAFDSQMAELVELAQAAGKKVVLEIPNPIIAGYTLVPPESSDRLEVLAKRERQLAARMHVAMVDQHGKYVFDPDLSKRLTDGVHPNDAFYREKALNLVATLAPIVCP